MKTVELYTRPGCSYCSAAKSFLLSRDIVFTEYNTAQNEQKLKQMLREPLIKSKMPLASQVFSDQDELLQA
ncbi:Glutaredoxin [Alteromonadaceae bacterium Bs31]|nr:Glutaredoxin [Alteromonadaceae bacterium Bs31]